MQDGLAYSVYQGFATAVSGLLSYLPTPITPTPSRPRPGGGCSGGGEE